MAIRYIYVTNVKESNWAGYDDMKRVEYQCDEKHHKYIQWERVKKPTPLVNRWYYAKEKLCWLCIIVQHLVSASYICHKCDIQISPIQNCQFLNKHLPSCIGFIVDGYIS